MRKSTRAISLTLVGSALILAGCSRTPPPDDTARDTSRSTAPGGAGGYSGGHYHGGHYYGGRVGGPVVIGGGRPGARPAQGGAVVRGGFGAAGHAAGGS
jgi:uncharacterized membrane protein